MSPSRTAASWLTAEQVADLPVGTAICVETRARRARIRGRFDFADWDGPLLISLGLQTPTVEMECEVPAASILRARVLPALFEEGDAVLLRGSSESQWRGGVIRTRGEQVRVETIGGFEWIDEALLVAADTLARPPALPRGRVPRNAVVNVGAG